MSDDWKKLQQKNQQLDESRFEAEAGDRLFLRVYLPGLIATFLLYFSDEFRADPLGQISIFSAVRDYLGQGVAALIATIAYWVVIGITMFGLYREERTHRLVIASWLLWAWFAWSVYFLGDLKLAFSIGWIAAMFSVKVIGTLESAYMIIRERMFLGSGK